MSEGIKNTKNRKIIALVSNGTDDSYLTPFVQSFIDECTGFGCKVMWFQSLSTTFYDTPFDRGEINIYNLINFDKIDALVIMAMTMKSEKTTDELIEKAKQRNIPIIMIDGENDSAYSISLEYENAFRKIIRHVIEEHNAKNLKFLGGSPGNESSDERENVFRSVMAEYGLPVTEDNIDYAFYWWSAASEAVQKHYDKFGSMPDAFICANDSMAVGVCFKLVELGYSIPEDVIVTGIDGLAEGNTFFPTITTLMCNVTEAGVTAAVRLNQIFNGEIPPTGNETVDGSVLFRESCGCEPLDRSVDDNRLKHDLYDQIELWNGFSDETIKKSETATGSYSFEEALDKIKLFLDGIWTCECWLCICDGFIAEGDIEIKDDSPVSYENYLKEGYAPVIKYVVHGINDSEFDFLEPFNSEDMLPNFDEVFDKYNNITFLPLHFQDRCIGYIGFEFSNVKRNYHILYTLVTNISNVLENARIQHEMRMFTKKIEDIYTRDSLTHLYNRRGFYKFTPEIYKKCAAEKIKFMVLSIDLDGLKGINDTYGHQEGDNAIVTVAKALEAASEGNEIIARFGGDEYIVAGICHTNTYADEFIERFKKYIDDYNENSDKPYYVEASCGVVKSVPDPEKTVDNFIKLSDELMYAQKSARHTHRGRFRVKDRN